MVVVEDMFASRKMQLWNQEAAEERPGGGTSVLGWQSLEKSSLVLPKTLHGSRLLLVRKEA